MSPRTALASVPRDDKLLPPKIIMKPIRSLLLANEAPKGLDLKVRDSSSGSPLTDAELRASIYAKGLLQPLIFKLHDGKPYVIAGNRRLRFLREIFHDALDSSVQTQDVDDFGGDWREVAMDTNLSLPPHLVERYELIVALTKDLKLSPEDARLRWGMTARQFDQVMALGKMSPTIRQAWKDGEIDAKTAQAFTLEPDPKEQDKIFAAVKKNVYNRGRVDAHDVKAKIVPSNQREAGKLVAFVGVEACKRAKIIKQEDLFSTNHLVTDMKTLNKLVGDKLTTTCAALVKDGWSWAIPESKIEGNSWNYGSIQPAQKSAATAQEKARLAELKHLLDSDPADGEDFDDGPLMEEEEAIEEAIKARGFTPAQRAKAGCFLKISHDGSLAIEYGRVKPAERKKVEASERPRSTPKPKKPGQVTLTNALAERLSEQLEGAISASLHASPNVAVAALIAGFASSGHVIDVEIGNDSRPYNKNVENDFIQVLAGALSATPESREIMLTKIAAEALSISIHSAEAKSPLEDKALQALVQVMDAQFLSNALKEAFDAKDYFAGVSLEAIVAAVRASMGIAHAEKVAKMKKADAAKFAAANVPTTGWLPKQLRTVHYKGPLEIPYSAKDRRDPASLKKRPVKKSAKK